MQKTLMKRFLMLLMVLALVMSFAPAIIAQDAEDDHDTTEQVDEAAADAHGDEEAAADDYGDAAAEDHGAEEDHDSGSPLDPLGINTGLLFVQIFNFLLLFIILIPLMWRPAMNMLDARSAKIEKGIEDAAAAAKARQNAEAEAEKIRAEARQEAAKIVEEARSRGDEVAKSLETAARGAAEKIRSDADLEAKSARDQELAGLRDQVVSISVAMAQRLIGESLDDARRKALVEQFFAAVPDAAKSMSGSVEVISAMPLTDAEKEKAQKAIGADEISYSVDPSILGGVIVRSQDRVVDGSVRSNLSDLAGRLG